MKPLAYLFLPLSLFFSILLFSYPQAHAVCLDNDLDGITDCAGDCNDNDPNTYPGAVELCDGLDNDCNYRLPSNERDTDNDGFRVCAGDCNDYNAAINPGAAEVNCNNIDDDCNPLTADCTGQDNDGDGSVTPDDCNDGDPNTYPGAPELCDGFDNDCDTVIPANETDADGDGSRLCDNDCDDTNATVYPGAPELCDGIDNDCDTVIPANETDGDTDGYRICDNDCDDTDPAVNPGASEGPFGNATCSDGLDNDCDGQSDILDDNCAEPCLDNDGDGYGSNGVPACPNGSAIDCNDSNAAVNPGAVEGPAGNATCSDLLDNDCDGQTDASDSACGSPCADNDGDGYGTNGDPSCPFTGLDCDDSNASTYPGAAEICDGLDNDCNYRLPSNERDSDADTYLVCEGDCNDYNANINPGAAEINCNGIDDDCNSGTFDCVGQDNDGDGHATPSDCDDGDPNVYPGAAEICDGKDNDCDTVIPANETDADGDGSRLCDNDCDDTNATVYPGATELCDGLDNDCDTVIPANEADGDTDGYRLCDGDCDDTDPAVNPGTTEGPFGNATCSDGKDNDCDGAADALDSACLEPCIDNDNDGYGTNSTTACPNTGIDCNDTNAAVNPGAAEGPAGNATCSDLLDNDCDGSTDAADNACGSPCADGDGDGYGTNGDPTCPNTGFDCDDGNASTYPGANEICDGLDNDCNYRIPSNERDNDADGYLVCSGDCNDYNVNINPGMPEIQCNGIDDDCNSSTFDCVGQDNDGDGSVTPDDCDDGDPNTYPGAAEICDGKDNDCDTVIPANETDADGDGSRLCDNDCDDTNATVYPGATELCDGIDNDCDTVIPANEADGDTDSYRICDNDCDDTDPAVNPGASEGPFGNATCSDTKDNDCDGTTDGADSGCAEPCIDNDGDGYGSNGVAACPNGTAIDCDDTNAAVNPNATEGPSGDATCSDLLDNDCDGQADDLDTACGSPCADNDGDGYGTNNDPTCQFSGFDCDDTNPATYPGATEICDGLDNDCNYRIPTDERDADGDSSLACAGDCNDYDANIFPGNAEICGDSKDNNCDNITDDTCPPICGTDPTQTDGPHMEVLLNPDGTIHPDQTALRCGKCHGPNTSDPIRYACQRCHADPNDPSDPLNGEMKVLYPLPLPYGFGSAPNVKVHSSDTVGTKYGNWDMDCLTCHNNHRQEQNAIFGTSYGKLVKRSICYDNPVTLISTVENVTFTNNTGAGSFADGPPYTDNICNTCHSQTNHHQNDGTAPGGQDHNNSTDCTQCHPHSQGFKPTCGSCHDAPPPTGTHAIHFGGTKDEAIYGSTAITQDAAPQSTIYLMNCGNCHPMDQANHANGIPNSGGGTAEIELYNPAAPAGSLKALNPPTATYTPGSTLLTDAMGMQYTEGTCDNVYCHSYKDVYTTADIPFPTNFYPPLIYDPPWETFVIEQRLYLNPQWGVDALGCDGCHGNPIQTVYPTVSAGAGDSHGWIDQNPYPNLHTFNMGFGPLQCKTCHYDTARVESPWTQDISGFTYFEDIPIFNTANHVNGFRDILFTPDPILYATSGGDVYHDVSTASFDPATSTCSNVSCHLSQTDVVWGSPYRWASTPECNVCHQY